MTTPAQYEAAIRWLEMMCDSDTIHPGPRAALAIVREAAALASLPVEEPIPEVDDASDEMVRSGLVLAWQLVKGERYAATSDERKLAVVALNMQGKRDALNRRLRAEVPDAR